MERRIFHLRIICFAVAAARACDVSLRHKPVVVAAGVGPRAAVLAASEEARGDGVWRGLSLAEALRRCPRAVVLPPDPDLYARASAAVGGLLGRFTPLVEPERGGRFFADLTGTHRLFGAAVDVAARLQKEIRERFRLPANAGVAVNKLVSGVAARVIRPVGLCDVTPGQEESFLRPVAVRNLPAVGAEVEGRLLSDLNVTHVGQLAALPVPVLVIAFGRRGPILHRQAHGMDDTPVRPPSRALVVEGTATRPEDTNDDAALLADLYGLIERGCRRLRQTGLFAGEALLAVRYSDGATASRRVPLSPPLDRDLTLFASLRPAFESIVARRGRVRSITLRLARLGPAPAQLSLFPDPDEATALREGAAAAAGGGIGPVIPPVIPDPWRLTAGRERSLLAAIDRLRGKYGDAAVAVGRAARGREDRDGAAGGERDRVLQRGTA